ncbi:hypothetical protein RZN22_01085 [Bacillaceae bacterium S4-13-58]
MKKKLTIWFIFIACSFLFLFLFGKGTGIGEQPVIKYFPLETDVYYKKASTDLQVNEQTDEDEYEIDWGVSSELDKPAYLRQDISLLYADGILIGMIGKWKQDTALLSQRTTIHGEDHNHYSSISYHHSEIHYPDDQIKSIQLMSKDELYVIDSPMSPLESFKKPETNQEQEWKETLDHATSQQLEVYWEKWMNYFQIPKENYHLIPLTSLPEYNQKPLPGLSMDDSQRVIGQLWEGLYREYFLRAKMEKSPKRSVLKKPIPLILLQKNSKQLLVLFEDRSGRIEKLIQFIDPI